MLLQDVISADKVQTNLRGISRPGYDEWDRSIYLLSIVPVDDCQRSLELALQLKSDDNAAVDVTPGPGTIVMS